MLYSCASSCIIIDIYDHINSISRPDLAAEEALNRTNEQRRNFRERNVRR